MEAETAVLRSVPRQVVQVAAWLCVVLTAYLSLIPSAVEVRTEMPGQLEHVMAYFGTSLLFALGYPRKLWLIVLGLVAYASLLEGLQSFSPGRTPSLLDASASWLGVVLGVAAVSLSGRWFKSRPM